MPNPSKCISTAEMFFLKTSISAEWHTSDLVWLRQKGSLLILHPFFRYCIKFQTWTRAYIQTHSPPHQIHELIVLKSYAPVVKLPAVKVQGFGTSNRLTFNMEADQNYSWPFYLWEFHVWGKNRNDFTAPLCP